MNKLAIIGNLTRDVELRTTQSGKSVANFTVAVNRRAKPGEKAEADFFRVSVWDKQAETCQKYLAKGRKVCVFEVSASAHTPPTMAAPARRWKYSRRTLNFWTARSRMHRRRRTRRLNRLRRSTPRYTTRICRSNGS